MQETSQEDEEDDGTDHLAGGLTRPNKIMPIVGRRLHDANASFWGMASGFN